MATKLSEMCLENKPQKCRLIMVSFTISQVSYFTRVGRLSTLWDSPGIIFGQPSVGESQASGRAQGVRTFFEESLRVHKLSLESRIGEKTLIQCKVLPWLIEFVDNCYQQHLVGNDGRTAFERMRHNLRKGEVLLLGCQVMLRFRGKVAGGRNVASKVMIGNPSEFWSAIGCTL